MNLDDTTAKQILDRCLSAGLVAWRVDTTGVAICGEAPDIPAFADAIASWQADDGRTPYELSDGRSLLPFPIVEESGGRIGYVVVRSPASSDLSPAGLYALLSESVDDLGTSSNQLVHLDGFAAHLSDAYETITALYSIGRAMADIAAPQTLLDAVVTRLHETTPFRWVTCIIGSTSNAPAPVAGFARCKADTPELGGSILENIDWFFAQMDRLPEDERIVMFRDPSLVPDTFGGETLVAPIRRRQETIGVVAMGDRGGTDEHVSSYDTMLLEAIGGYVQSFLDNVSLYEEQRAMFLGVVKAITASIDAKDAYTRGHSERVALLGRQLAEAMGMPPERVEQIYVAGLVHDVGKIGVPERVLCKPGRLDDDEFALIKLHPEIGHKILSGISSMQPMLPGVLSHHERWDGRGYPHGLAGEAIPEIARVLCLADTFDAMSSSRAYRPAMPRAKVLSEIERCAGTQFDPAMVPYFMCLDFSEFDRLAAHAPAQNAA